MSNLETILNLFKTADSISIDDYFIRYPSADISEDGEVEITLEDERFEFSKDHLSGAFYDRKVNAWTIFDSRNGKYVDVTFYTVTPMTMEITQ